MFRGIHRTLPNEEWIPELFGDIETTLFQWVSDEEWLSFQSGDCEEVGGNSCADNGSSWHHAGIKLKITELTTLQISDSGSMNYSQSNPLSLD